MKNVLVYVLMPIVIAGLAALLVFLIVVKPVSFENQKNSRYDRAVEKLKAIRTLQVAFRNETGHYTADFDSLVNFYKSGQIRIVRQIGSMDDSLAVVQKRVFRDTVRIPVKDTLLRNISFRIDSLAYASTSQQFEMRTRTAQVSGLEVPLFEAYASNEILLDGLDKQSIINLNDAQDQDYYKPLSAAQVARMTPEQKARNPYLIQGAENRRAGRKVGNVDQPNNNVGNWE